MLPQVGFVEFMVLAIVALLVVGPRDLPKLMRRVGGLARKARGMADEFRQAFDEMGREAELGELKKELEDLKRANPLKDMESELKTLDADARAAWRDDARPLKGAVEAPVEGESPTPAEPKKTGAAGD